MINELVNKFNVEFNRKTINANNTIIYNYFKDNLKSINNLLLLELFLVKISKYYIIAVL